MPFSIAGPASPALPSLDGINRATERISSGLRTEFQEQAAEAAISGRLDSQIGESTIDIRNAVNQISALQKADQTLGQGKELTQRIQELAIQSSSKLLPKADQLAIDQEMSGLVQDLDDLFQQAKFNDGALFGSHTVDVSQVASKISEIDSENVDQNNLAKIQDQIVRLQADAGAQLNDLDRSISEQFETELNLYEQRSQLTDTDLATDVAELIKEQLLFEASVKAFDHQKMAESSILQLLN